MNPGPSTTSSVCQNCVENTNSSVSEPTTASSANVVSGVPAQAPTTTVTPPTSTNTEVGSAPTSAPNNVLQQPSAKIETPLSPPAAPVQPVADNTAPSSNLINPFPATPSTSAPLINTPPPQAPPNTTISQPIHPNPPQPHSTPANTPFVAQQPAAAPSPPANPNAATSQPVHQNTLQSSSMPANNQLATPVVAPAIQQAVEHAPTVAPPTVEHVLATAPQVSSPSANVAPASTQPASTTPSPDANVSIGHAANETAANPPDPLLRILKRPLASVGDGHESGTQPPVHPILRKPSPQTQKIIEQFRSVIHTNAAASSNSRMPDFSSVFDDGKPLQTEFDAYIQNRVFDPSHPYADTQMMLDERGMRDFVRNFTRKPIFVDHKMHERPIGELTRAWIETKPDDTILRGHIQFDTSTKRGLEVVKTINAIGGTDLSLGATHEVDRFGRRVRTNIHEISVVGTGKYGGSYLRTQASASPSETPHEGTLVQLCYIEIPGTGARTN